VPSGPSGSSANPFTPQQIQDAYGVNLLSQQGSGQTIAIIGAYNAPTIASDLATFDAAYGLPAPPSFQVLNETGGSNLPQNGPQWAGEGTLDVEWAHAVAPQANIILFEATVANFSNLMNAVDTARNWPGVSVVSMSWDYTDYAGESANDFHFTTPAGHAGVTFLAASGDYATPAMYPADSPNVVGVGGTSLTTNGNAYVSESGWDESGGGPTPNEPEPLYQEGVQTSGERESPDVAFDADPNTGVSVCFQGAWSNVGGTSVSAPCWAGLIAIADQLRVSDGGTTLDGPSQTLPLLYQLPSRDFHIISGGNNGYSVGPGYNMVTGLGSPVANLLVPDLALGPSPDLTITSTHAGNFTQGDVGDTYIITVTNSGTSPTSGLVTVSDLLPAGLTATGVSGAGWSGNLGTLTASRNDALPPGASYPPLEITVNVATSASASVTNTAVVSGGGEVITANDSATDPTAINEPPLLSGIETDPLNYIPGNPPQALTAAVAVTDAESTTLAGATIWISGDYKNGEDVLSFTNTPNITGTWQAATGTLTLTGTDTLANYQAALRSVTYQDAIANPDIGVRTVSIQVQDTLAGSNVLTRQIVRVVPLNSPPVLANIEAAPLAYMQNDPATAITSSLTVGNVESTLNGATVSISDNYQNGEDVLAFSDTAGITGNWDASTGILTLSGSDTLADYQAALRSVTYVDTAFNPSSATRTVSYEVGDGLAESNVVTRQITVTPVATWDGNPSGNMSDPANWVAGVAPNPAIDDIVLGGPTASAPRNDFPAGSILSNLTLDGNCTLTGNSARLDSLIWNSSGNNSLTLPLSLGDDGLFDVSAGSLEVGGTINNGGNSLTVSTESSTTAILDGSISGSGSLVKVGTGTLVITAQNAYSGGTSVLGGTLQVTSSVSIPSGSALIVGIGSDLLFGVASSQSKPVATPAIPAIVAATPTITHDSSALRESGGPAAVVAGTATVQVDSGGKLLQLHTLSIQPAPADQKFGIGNGSVPPGPATKHESASMVSDTAWAIFAREFPADRQVPQPLSLTASLVDSVLSQRKS
jgi:uncharacterized repeat protein (TIGR01451 family)